MKNFIKVIKALLNALMTLILIIGSTFIFLYVIGIEPFVVESGSMEPSIHVGSLCFVNKHVAYEDIKEQDIIAFTIGGGKRVTHRVVNITNEGFQTKGDANSKPDEGFRITKDNYIGKSIFSIPQAGYLVKALQTTKGKIVLVTIIVVLIVGALCIGDKKGKRFKEEESKE